MVNMKMNVFTGGAPRGITMSKVRWRGWCVKPSRLVLAALERGERPERLGTGGKTVRVDVS